MLSINLKRRIGFLAIATAITAGCSVAPSTADVRSAGALRAQDAETSLYPVTAGLRWDYVLRQKQNDGSIKERPMAMGVARSARGADGVVEAVLERRTENLVPPPTRVRVQDDAVVLSRLADPVGGPSLTILHLPPVAGAQWPGRPLTGGNSERIIVRGEETVTVPSGTYRAVHVDHALTYATGDTDMLEYWYAPGVGCVRMIERTTLVMGGTPMKLAVEGVLASMTPGGWMPLNPVAAPTEKLGRLMPESL